MRYTVLGKVSKQAQCVAAVTIELLKAIRAYPDDSRGFIPETALIEIYDIDIEVSSVAGGGECDALAVRRPRRMPVIERVVYESGQVFFPSASTT